MQVWIPVVSSSLYFWKSICSFRVDSILKWRVYIKLKVSWLRAILWCMSQTSCDRVNSGHVQTHEKNSGDAVRRLGTIIQSIFCAQSGASICLTVWSGESWYPGAFPPVLENFRRAFSPGPTKKLDKTASKWFQKWTDSKTQHKHKLSHFIANSFKNCRLDGILLVFMHFCIIKFKFQQTPI